MFESIRVILFVNREIRCLVLQKSRDLDAWLGAWKSAQKLPDQERRKIEWAILEGMKDIHFSFEEGHRLYNEGLCNGLGRKAMWLGTYLASTALARLKKEARYREHILDMMLETLNPKRSEELSREDKMAVNHFDGRFSRMAGITPRS